MIVASGTRYRRTEHGLAEIVDLDRFSGIAAEEIDDRAIGAGDGTSVGTCRVGPERLQPPELGVRDDDRRYIFRDSTLLREHLLG